MSLASNSLSKQPISTPPQINFLTLQPDELVIIHTIYPYLSLADCGRLTCVSKDCKALIQKVFLYAATLSIDSTFNTSEMTSSLEKNIYMN